MVPGGPGLCPTRVKARGRWYESGWLELPLSHLGMARQIQLARRVGDGGEAGLDSFGDADGKTGDVKILVGDALGVHANDVGVEFAENFRETGDQTRTVAAADDHAMGDAATGTMGGIQIKGFDRYGGPCQFRQ